MNSPWSCAAASAMRGLPLRLAQIGLAAVLAVLFSTSVRAAENPPAAPQSNPPRLTERDYLIEELDLAEQLLQIEQTRFDQGRSPSEKVLGARRSVLSLKRQLAAYDERTKRPTPEQEIERKRRVEEDQRKAEARKREADAEAERIQALKQELLSVLAGIARKDADAQVRQTAVISIGRLQLEASIEPLSGIALRDSDNNVRQAALQNIIGFRNGASTAALLGLYDQLSDVNLKLAVLAGLQEHQKITNGSGLWPTASVVPAAAVAKLIEVAHESPSRELRQAALMRLTEVPGEKISAHLVAIYDASSDNEFKQQIVNYLGNRPDGTAMRKLTAIAQGDPDPRARQMAVDRIGRAPLDSNLPRMLPPGMRFPQPLPPAPPPPLRR